MDVPLAGFLSCFLSCLLTCGATAGVGHVGGAAIGGAVGVAVSLLFSICILQGVRVYISAPLKDLYMVSGTMHGVSAQFKRPQRFDTFEEFANLKRRYLTADSYKPEPELPEADEPSDLLPEARSASSLSIPSAPILTFGASVPAPTGKVTFVFTDIEASSNLWCDHPEDMKVAMRLHNNMMRQCYQKYSGYEVKTIGDAFMITFESAENALNFCMEAQTTLLNADWPDDILLDSHCAPITKDGQLIFRGMRVRMGVHIGSVGVEVDPVSNRSDYYGHTVNIAARIESAGKGGCIICSEEIVSSISAPQSLACTFVNLGPVVLKGVGTVSLTGVLPNAISHRGTGLANPKKKASNTGSSSSQPSPMKSIPFSTTPGGAGHSKSSAFFKLLVKDMYNDRLLSDSLIRSTLESFMTSEELQPVNATVIQLRLTQNTQLLSPLLRSLSNIAKRTFGMLLSVATTTVTIVWFCQQHAIQASSCAALVFAELSGSYKIHMGMASGGVLLGVTHTGDDKHFITCIGSPVELSGALAEAAEQLNAPCLVPGTFVASVSSLARLLRPIDRWPFAGITQACVEVNELYMPGLEGVEKWDLLYGMQEDKTWVDAGYIAAYEASKNGDVTLMKNVLGRNPSDEVAKRIVMAKGKQITRTEFLPGTHIKTQDSIGAKEDLEAAWKRTTAASRSSTAELVYMEGWAYDVSTFMHSHPGGRETIKPHFGTDITDAFHGLGGGHEHSTYAAEILRTLRVFKTNNLATNESNMLIVRDTWKELRAVGMKEIGVLLFRNIFMSDPELLALFPWGGDRNVYESKGLHDHGLQVMTAIDKAVTDLSKSHEVAHILHELGKTHIRYGIKRNMFDIMGEAFDLTFRQALVDRYTPQVC